MYGMLQQFPAIEQHDEVICSRDMASTVSEMYTHRGIRGKHAYVKYIRSIISEVK